MPSMVHGRSINEAIVINFVQISSNFHIESQSSWLDYNRNRNLGPRSVRWIMIQQLYAPRVIHMGANAWLRIKTGISALVLPRKVHLRLAEKLPQKWGGSRRGPQQKGNLDQFGLWFCSLLYGFASNFCWF